METNNTRISYSQIRMYSECPKKYYYSYVERLREPTKSGALLFGTAIDKAVEAVLLDPKANEHEVFDEHWTTQDINGSQVAIASSLLVGYAASDFDFDLLDDTARQRLQEERLKLLPDLDLGLEEAIGKCKSFKNQKAFRTFKENEQRFLNLANWHSLRAKGHLMLAANRERVMPRIKRVISAQKELTLINEEGDKFLGYADLVCEWEDGSTVVIDYKTSAMEYAEDSVQVSPQLAMYAHALGIRRAGYIVLRKGINKNKVKLCSKCGFNGSSTSHKTCNNTVSGAVVPQRCHGAWVETINPEVNIQVLIGDIPPRTDEIVMENMDIVNKSIKAKLFPRNFNACDGGVFKCPYIGLCFSNCRDNLIKVEHVDKTKNVMEKTNG